MENNRRNSIVESAGSNGPDLRSQLNTLKPQQRAPEFSQRQPRPDFYQQGPYGAPNRPPGQQQRPPPPQQQQPRTPGDKVSPWNLLRQALPPDVGARGLVPSQQRPPPPPSQYYNMQQRQPPPPQDQQQLYRQQQPQQPTQDRRPNMSRVEDRPPAYRAENGRPARPVGGGGGGDDDEEVVVNTSVSQQPPPPQLQQQQQQQQPPLNRRDSTVFAGGRPGEGVEPNRQWQRLASMAQGAAAAAYGRPQPPQDQYGRQSMVMPEGGQEQRYPQAVNSYNRPQQQQQQQQDDDGNRPRPGAPNGLQKPARDGGAPPLTRRDSVLDAKAATDAAYGGRRPLPPDLQESDNGGRRAPPELGVRRPPQPPPSQQDTLQEDGRRPAEYRKTESDDALTGGGRRVPDYAKNTADNSSYPGKSNASRPDGIGRDYEQQQPRFERKASLEKDSNAQPKAADHGGNRASELRKAHYEAAHHMRPVREQQQYSRADYGGGGGDDDRATGRREPLQRAEDAAKSRDYYAARSTGETGEPYDRSRQRPDNNRDEPMFASQSKNSRPDTLKIIKDNEPLRDSSNSRGNYRGDNDVCKSPSKIPRKDRSELKTPTRAITPKSPEGAMLIGQKKLPMNKVQVGSAPSPNLKVVRSKVGSLQNTSHKPGGGQVKIENRKLEWKAGTRIEAKNDTYVPGGGDKKIQSVKLQWNAKPKVGSLENKTHKPGGGDKKIETVKLDFKDKAKPKIGSKDNIKHTPGGGAVKIEDQKLEIKAQSKVGSLDNVKHKPGGGEVKIFDDKSYIKQTAGQMGTPTKTQLRRSSSMKIPSSMKLYSPDERPKSQVKIVVTPTSEEDLYTKVGTETYKGGPRRSANSRSPSIQNNIVIPEEAVRTK